MCREAAVLAAICLAVPSAACSGNTKPQARRCAEPCEKPAPEASSTGRAKARRVRTKTGFVPPTARERVAAIGRLAVMSLASSASIRAFVPTPQFSAIAAPQQDDWLAKHREVGQTYDAWVGSRPNLPSRSRRTIYLLPIGRMVGEHGPDTRTLRRFVKAYFTLPVKVLPAVSVASVGATSRINDHTQKRQLLSTDILDYLQRMAPKDAYATLAITNVDLYPEDSWNFVFGQASLHNRVGVYSFARHHPTFHGDRSMAAKDAKKLALRRSLKVLAHEVTHMFGMHHCIYFSCVVNGSNSLHETDDSAPHACPVCLRKLHKATRFDPLARYRGLAKFYDSVGLEAEAAWVKQRVRYLTTTSP